MSKRKTWTLREEMIDIITFGWSPSQSVDRLLRLVREEQRKRCMECKKREIELLGDK